MACTADPLVCRAQSNTSPSVDPRAKRARSEARVAAAAAATPPRAVPASDDDYFTVTGAGWIHLCTACRGATAYSVTIAEGGQPPRVVFMCRKCQQRYHDMRNGVPRPAYPPRAPTSQELLEMQSIEPLATWSTAWGQFGVRRDARLTDWSRRNIVDFLHTRWHPCPGGPASIQDAVFRFAP